MKLNSLWNVVRAVIGLILYMTNGNYSCRDCYCWDSLLFPSAFRAWFLSGLLVIEISKAGKVYLICTIEISLIVILYSKDISDGLIKRVLSLTLSYLNYICETSLSNYTIVKFVLSAKSKTKVTQLCGSLPRLDRYLCDLNLTYNHLRLATQAESNDHCYIEWTMQENISISIDLHHAWMSWYMICLSLVSELNVYCVSCGREMSQTPSKKFVPNSLFLVKKLCYTFTSCLLFYFAYIEFSASVYIVDIEKTYWRMRD